MRHRKGYRKLGRPSTHRIAMFRNMVSSLFKHERILTTVQKAKEARKIAERIITWGKKGTIHHRRLAERWIQDKEVLNKVFGELAERYKNRNGGYTRIVRIGFRRGDGAELALFELVDRPVVAEKK